MQLQFFLEGWSRLARYGHVERLLDDGQNAVELRGLEVAREAFLCVAAREGNMEVGRELAQHFGQRCVVEVEAAGGPGHAVVVDVGEPTRTVTARGQQGTHAPAQHDGAVTAACGGKAHGALGHVDRGAAAGLVHLQACADVANLVVGIADDERMARVVAYLQIGAAPDAHVAAVAAIGQGGVGGEGDTCAIGQRVGLGHVLTLCAERHLAVGVERPGPARHEGQQHGGHGPAAQPAVGAGAGGRVETVQGRPGVEAAGQVMSENELPFVVSVHGMID
ncbi:hypothetical protein HMPREF9136_2160 [Prevotella dentalis DSM 3688]|uniref:Uncharacterized protein n=1 Tax=Prevotella dentalis (strain ATCC 49559 / DSM 3688 / JCM 13448 / NCTC 12043 / ES 2772) TaxID=908937 RepID=F9D5N2_PREDD|nr:hypothetical protein HMPREF9136_2160 [Prevotella dentalis DSM 3688]